MLKLSQKDRRIICELNRDSRQSFSSLSKTIRCPKSVVAYRIKRLTDAGLLTLFCTIVDHARLGYSFWRLQIKFRNFAQEDISFIKQLDHVYWAARMEGDCDLSIIFLVKNSRQLEKEYSRLVHEYSNSILEKDITAITRQYFLPYRYIADSSWSGYAGPAGEACQLQKEDYTLINLIKEDSRRPLLDIAKKMKTSPASVRYRLKRLMKQGIIKRFGIRIDHTKLNFHHFHTSLRLENLTETVEKDLIAFLSSEKKVIYVAKGLGRWDLEFQTIMGSHFELNELISRLRAGFPANISYFSNSLVYQVYPVNTVKY
jgi:DNA-binding Lrp family transcriptional regulator